jgi:hypothetical protein
MALKATAKVSGQVGVTEHSALTILDRAAQLAQRAAAQLVRDAIKQHAPVGPGRGGKHLRDQHRYSVTQIPHGYQSRQRRTAAGWYGRIVENGRKAGFSRGRHYPAARANPYVQEAADVVEPAATALLEAGAADAAKVIEAEAVL